MCGLQPPGGPRGLQVPTVSREQRLLQMIIWLCACPAACCSPDRLLAFLLPKLDANNERTRVGTLQVVRHVINSAGEWPVWGRA